MDDLGDILTALAGALTALGGALSAAFVGRSVARRQPADFALATPPGKPSGLTDTLLTCSRCGVGQLWTGTANLCDFCGQHDLHRPVEPTPAPAPPSKPSITRGVLGGQLLEHGRGEGRRRCRPEVSDATRMLWRSRS